MKRIDYIIVGQGLAGTMLSWFLKKAGRSVLVVAEVGKIDASHVAGGIMNPITGKRIVKTWMAETIFPFAENVYREMETTLGHSFLKVGEILKIMSSKEMAQQWKSRMMNSEIEDYVEEGHDFPYSDFFSTEFGFYKIKSAMVKTGALLEEMKKMLDGQLVNDRVNFAEFEFSDNRVCWKDYEASKVLFCEGFEADGSQAFDFIPFVLAKGEVLTVRTHDEIKHVVNNNVYVWQSEPQMWNLASTYEWNFKDLKPTPQAKENLLRRFKKMYNKDCEVVQQKAGIRPTIKDRRPVIGLHPQYPQVGIFNGLGTKGYSLAPFFANHFVEHLEKQKPLISEIDIQRFCNN